MNKEEIKSLMEKLELDSMALAHRLGVRELTVYRWLKNKASPSRLVLPKLKRLQRKIEQCK